MLALVALIVAAAVDPDKYALWGLGAMVLNAGILGTLGMEKALIFFSARGEERDYLDAAFYATAAFGIALFLAGFFGAPLLAHYLKAGFSEEDVTIAIRLTSVTALCVTIESVPAALLDRRLAFRRRAVPDIGSAVFYVLLTFALFVAGAGIWSLIVARCAYALVRTASLWAVAPARPRLKPTLKPRIFGAMLRYGVLLNVAGILAVITQNVDTLSVARIAGAAPTGAYVLAFTLASFVPTFLGASLMRVAYPLFVKAATIPGRLRDPLATVVHATVSVMAPVTVGLAFVAPPLLERVFGESWAVAGQLLTILAFYGLFRALIDPLSVSLNATGQPRGPVAIQAFALAISVVLLWPLSDSGARGVATAFTVGQAAGLSLALLLTHGAWSMDMGRQLMRPIAAAVLALGGSAATRLLASERSEPWVAAGVFLVLAAVFMLALDPLARGLLRAFRLRFAPTAHA